MVVLDTHALLWWTLDPSRLSKRAAVVCERIEKDGGFISSVSLWELGIKIKNGKLDIGMTIAKYLDGVRTMNTLEIIPVDEDIWLESLSLDWSNRDPADRVIVATAKMKKLPILSKDGNIKRYYRKTIW